MNLTALQTALKRYGFDDSDPLTTWINAGLRQFVDSYQWPFLEALTTVALTNGVNVYSLTAADANFRKLRSVMMTDVSTNPTTYSKLKYYEAHTFDRIIDNPAERGTPQIYTLIGMDAMQVWPVPNKTTFSLSIRSLRRIPELSAGGDIPAIPTEYHFTIVRAAAVIALQAENEEDRSVAAQNAYEADLQSAIQFYSRHEDDDALSVDDVQEYGFG